MTKYTGRGASRGIAIGKIRIFDDGRAEVEKRDITDIGAERERLVTAKNNAIKQLSLIYEKAVKRVGEENAEIFDIHIMMIEDEDYNDRVTAIIETGVNAEYAVTIACDEFSERFSSMDDEYMRERAADIRDISQRIIRCLSGSSEEEADSDEPYIICADDLSPSETITLDKDKVIAFVTAGGSVNSHTAILARSMNIPAVTGLGKEFLSEIKNGQRAVVDGEKGELFVNPDSSLSELMLKREKVFKEERNELISLKGLPNITADGRKIDIFANIGSVGDIEAVMENDGGGIGLFRSEFLYLGRQDYPDENEQFRAYRYVLEKMNPKRVIIRTLDIGADKQAEYFGLPKEENPALGLRAIRISLTRPELFRTQLRALYRASVYGNLGIMFPMITSAEEVEEILEFCKKIRAELKKEGIEFSENVQLGIMIETPASAIISDILAPMVDFFSVGTNDLIQYTLACDRRNDSLERFTNPRHEAVMRLIEKAARSAHENGKWIGICGELGSDTFLTGKFIEMGIDELSVSPSDILRVRKAVRNYNGQDK